jgi:hypothetical protein
LAPLPPRQFLHGFGKRAVRKRYDVVSSEPSDFWGYFGLRNDCDDASAQCLAQLNASRTDPAIRAEHKERFARLEAAVAKSAISGHADVRHGTSLLSGNADALPAQSRRSSTHSHISVKRQSYSLKTSVSGAERVFAFSETRPEPW